ncbi:hypothetical protein [Shewanella indica]|uniref:phenylacetate--CoA ligase family protein n=1 Tax=Shewanella indica TaxID=768528 RepID=UPI003003EBE2
MKVFLFYLKYFFIRFHSIKRYLSIIKSESLDNEQLSDLQLKKMKALFSHAKRNSPYYADKFKNISESDINSIKDWEKLPILTKEDIRLSENDIKIKNVSSSRFREVTTGGSSGQPLKLFHDKNHPVDALGWRALTWWGVHPSDNIGFIYRKVRVGFNSILNYVLWLPTKRFFLDASLINERSMELFISKIKKNKPKIINGYVGAVVEFSRYCLSNNIDIKGVEAVWVTAAPLSEANRILIQKAFNCSVFDQYGCSEIYWVAVECKQHNGLHVFEDARYVEILDNNNNNVQDGKYGTVAITDLENYAFPLIRYINGDRGRFLHEEPCDCGLKYKKLDKIKGRISECLRSPHGNVIAGEYLTTIFDDKPDLVSDFQIRQLHDYSVILYCVINQEDEETMSYCNSKVKLISDLLGGGCDVTLSIVNKIEHDDGKTRFIRSDIKVN